MVQMKKVRVVIQEMQNIVNMVMKMSMLLFILYVVLISLMHFGFKLEMLSVI
jgi:hypothetical protein